MMVNGFNPGVPQHEAQQVQEQHRQTQLEKEMAEQRVDIELKRAESEKEKDDQEQSREDSGKFVMNEYQLKELLFMMNSRGTSSSVEQLVDQLKKEKERLSRS